ncbi:F-box protein [Frankliniella fusca]|uniref:F-box protein n=1 Tax=Frankliniella fusca TaxID=407009 RepID=A0AAE1LMG9_9NEOP|nr:F-box protein [Frankliniella fusca]
MAIVNPHPDGKLIAQLYRLISVYSLVSPPKGSNLSEVSNAECFTKFWNIKLINMAGSPPKEIEVITLERKFSALSCPVEQFPLSVQEEQNYDKSTTEKYFINFMSGFTCHRQKKITKNCQECLKTLTKDREHTTYVDSWTLMKEIHDGYSIPSDTFVSLIGAVEFAVLCASGHDLHIFEIEIEGSCFVDCLDHIRHITEALVTYYFFTTMFFAADMSSSSPVPSWSPASSSSPTPSRSSTVPPCSAVASCSMPFSDSDPSLSEVTALRGSVSISSTLVSGLLKSESSSSLTTG